MKFKRLPRKKKKYIKKLALIGRDKWDDGAQDFYLQYIQDYFMNLDY